MDFNERLKEYMVENGLNQSDLAKVLGVSSGYISMLLRGERTPNTKLIVNLSNISNKSSSWWLHGVEKYNNLYALNSLIDIFIEDGSIDANGNMDEATQTVLINMLRKEINTKLKNKNNAI